MYPIVPLCLTSMDILGIAVKASLRRFFVLMGLIGNEWSARIWLPLIVMQAIAAKEDVVNLQL